MKMHDTLEDWFVSIEIQIDSGSPGYLSSPELTVPFYSEYAALCLGGLMGRVVAVDEEGRTAAQAA